MAHFFMSMSGSKIREQVAHFLVDIHSRNLLMWDIRLKTTMYSIRSNGPYLTLIGTVFTAFPGKGCYLKAQFLHDTLNFLLVHANPF